MNPIFGWTLAFVGIFGGLAIYGWQGLVLAVTIVAFWLLLQFGQVLRVMRGAASSPMGRVESAVMLHAKLHRGMRMINVVKLTRSLGRNNDDGQNNEGREVFAWSDGDGNHVIATFAGGRLQSWDLERPA